MSKGFVIMAQDVEGSDTYYKCATALKSNLNYYMPDIGVTILTSNDLPYGDIDKDNSWKLANDWQVYEASPYDLTIKLEADMIITKDMSYWFDVFSKQDVVVCTKIRNFQGKVSTQRLYRRFIDDNNLPDTYNAITFFKKSDTAKKFYDIIKDVFTNWKEYKDILKCNKDEKVTTDWAYAIACHIIGVDKTTMPVFNELSMVHMKQYINGTPTENWTDTFIYEIFKDKFRVNTYLQLYPVHYHVKSFADKILKVYNYGS